MPFTLYNLLARQGKGIYMSIIPYSSPECTDTGNALRFARQQSKDGRNGTPHPAWYKWDGRRWKVVSLNCLQALAKLAAQSLPPEAISECEGEQVLTLGFSTDNSGHSPAHRLHSGDLKAEALRSRKSPFAGASSAAGTEKVAWKGTAV